MLCSFIAPMFCESAHAHADFSNQMDHQSAKKSDVGDNHQKPGKTAMHDCCCLGHHCCAAKLMHPVEFGLFELRPSKVVQAAYTDQHVSSFHLSSLDRPPKNLV